MQDPDESDLELWRDLWQTSTPPAPLSPVTTERLLKTYTSRFSRTPLRTLPLVFAFAGACLGGILLLLVLGTVLLASGAVPNTPLYPVKLRVEEARLALAPSTAARLHLHVEFATERLKEAEAATDPAVAQLALTGYQQQVTAVEQMVTAAPLSLDDGRTVTTVLDTAQATLVQIRRKALDRGAPSLLAAAELTAAIRQTQEAKDQVMAAVVERHTPTPTVTATQPWTITPTATLSMTSTDTPTLLPSSPTTPPTASATMSPTMSPTARNTAPPTEKAITPTVPPATATPGRTIAPSATALPTETPVPSGTPTAVPTEMSTATPTATYVPTDIPTDLPTLTATDVPTQTPTLVPSDTPTDIPTLAPTDVPTVTDTPLPTDTDVPTATDVPSDTPTALPTAADIPTDVPTDVPTDTAVPTATATDEPTVTPTDLPTLVLQARTTMEPTATDIPTVAPASTDAGTPTEQP